MKSTSLLSGSQAIARGAYEAGAQHVVGFPGAPVSDIIAAFDALPDTAAHWSPNEKVGLEVALGISQGGARTLAALQHIGMNIAADPLIASAYSGVNGGLVIAAIDDPGMLSSMNEQDTRHFARAAKLPMLAPSDPQETIEFMKLGFSMSEKYDVPVLLRMTTRLCNTRGLCMTGEAAVHAARNIGLKSPKTVADGLSRHEALEKQLAAIEVFSTQAFEINTIDVGSSDVGIITSAVPYLYAKEVLPTASFLKLGILHPLPHKLISYFATLVKRLYVVEELDPFLEEQIKAMGITVIGKDAFPRTGELTPDIVAKGLSTEGAVVTSALSVPVKLPSRQSNLCLSCAHRGLMNVFQAMNLNVVGDIGCFNPGELPPADPEEMDACFCIGASMSVAFGLSLASDAPSARRTVSVVSGSTFMHSGLPALANIVQNSGTATVCLLAAPSNGDSVVPASTVDYRMLCEGVGVRRIRTVHPDDEQSIEAALREELDAPGVSVIISAR
ncbi:MAG: indolepyruvate ferredoxin oxidoreductase subunit alpha [Ignavibacteria bacterium]|nr:indolepyruvate ferredoxin oxidoreductase subunit alpha [Ignavibacteria bacterium]